MISGDNIIRLTHSRLALPIDSRLPEILASLAAFPNLVVEAAPGSGKTTRVPAAMLGWGGEILVLEPRRIAARTAAHRVAQEMGEKPGVTVGFQVRFEEVAGPRTRLRFLTEGMFTRRLLSDATLRGISAVVLDEFHERHLDTDLALALLRRLQKTTRPDLRIVIMSATLDPGPVAHFLGDCPVIRTPGRLHPIDITHQPYSPVPLEEQVTNALARLLGEQAKGDVLAFLPGAAEIRRALRACEALARKHHLLVLPLYGDLSTDEQDRALAPASQRKVILATNIAESSITIEGVTAVIDSGLARIASDSPWTGLPSIQVQRISKASAIQRAGRAGRTAPGLVLRLFTAEDYHRRPEHDSPEIARRELSPMRLQLRAMNTADNQELSWLDEPPAQAWQAAQKLLDKLGAVGDRAIAMAKLPLHPRLSRLVLEAIGRGVGEDACAVAALLSSGDRPRSSDLLRALDEELTGRTRQVYQQIRRIAHPLKSVAQSPHALALSVLTAFPDRVARKRSDDQYLLTGGLTASLDETAFSEAAGEFVVAVDVEERSERALPLIRLACPIQPEWLIDLFPHAVLESTGVEWNRSAERVDRVTALVYENLVIDETRAPAESSDETARLLEDKVFEAGLSAFLDQADLDEWLARVQFAAEHSALRAPDDNAVRIALEAIIRNSNSFAQVRILAPQLKDELARKLDRATLEEAAPLKLRLPGGRQTRIHYESGKTPWVASRLQDFFGLRESPRIGRGQVPLVLHLLAPNQRAVQTTTDLNGFWERLYPQLRRELGRCYPRHAWPEKPY